MRIIPKLIIPISLFVLTWSSVSYAFLGKHPDDYSAAEKYLESQIELKQQEVDKFKELEKNRRDRIKTRPVVTGETLNDLRKNVAKGIAASVSGNDVGKYKNVTEGVFNAMEVIAAPYDQFDDLKHTYNDEIRKATKELNFLKDVKNNVTKAKESLLADNTQEVPPPVKVVSPQATVTTQPEIEHHIREPREVRQPKEPVEPPEIKHKRMNTDPLDITPTPENPNFGKSKPIY